MWFACLGILIAIMIWRLIRVGPRHALGVGVTLSFLFPAWFIFQLGEFPISLRIATAGFGLLAYVLYCPTTFFRTRLVFLDYAMMAFLVTYLISDWMNDGFSWIPIVSAYGEWLMPYLVGRVVIQDMEDVRELLPYVAILAVVYSFVAAFEALVRINLVELAFGERPVDGASRTMTRLGMKRSFGPLRHPIYFGTIQLMLLPWLIYGAHRAFRKSAPIWWIWLPLFALAGIFFALSRGPWLGVIIALYVAFIVMKTEWRKVLIGIGIVGGILAIFQRDFVLDMVRSSVGERTAGTKVVREFGGTKLKIREQNTITIDGETVKSSSSQKRFYLFDAYKQSIMNAGAFGYGTESVNGFPVNVPYMPQGELLERLTFIDNVYILFTLRFGFVGLLCLVTIFLAATFTYGSLGWHKGWPGRWFVATMTGVCVAMMVILLTVWLPDDFGFWFIISIGGAAGLKAFRYEDEDGQPAAEYSQE